MRYSLTPGGPAKYRLIADDIRHQIQRGTLRPGDELPTADQLAERYQVTRPTIQAAFRALRALGLLETGPGRPAIVRARPRPQPIRRPGPGDPATPPGAVEHVDYTGTGIPPATVAALLGLDHGQGTFQRTSTLTAPSGHPIRRQSAYIAPYFMGSSERYSAYDPIDDLPALMRASHRGDWPETDTATITSARMPTPEEAAALAMSDGVPLLVVCVAEHTAGKRELPLYVLEYCWPADRYEIHESTADPARS
jgi:GntR family transcriptional regulator